MTERTRVIFDQLTGHLEDFGNRHIGEIQMQEWVVRNKLLGPIFASLPLAKSRSAQFSLLQDAVSKGEALFAQSIEDLPKELLMSVARRAPSAYLEGATVLMASLIVKYSTPKSTRTFDVAGEQNNNLGVILFEDEIMICFKAMAIAKAMHNFQGMARWLGKGGKLVAADNNLAVDLPSDIRDAVDHYERRRPARPF